MRADKTVAGRFVALLTGILEPIGITRDEQLKTAGLTEAEIADADARVGRDQFERLLTIGVALPPAPPLHDSLERWGESFPLEATSWVNAPTLRAGLTNFITYRPLISELDELHVQVRDARVQIVYHADIRTDVRQIAIQAHALFILLSQIVRGYDDDLTTRFTATLSGPKALGASLQEYLGGLVTSGDENALCFSAPLLDAQYPHLNPRACAFACRALDARLATLQRSGTLAARIERFLASGGGLVEMGATRDPQRRVCAMLNMSRWTLARRLAEEGMTFERLLAAVRVREARRLLRESCLHVSEVARQVGFSSTSSFSRFFHDCTGQRPLTYRDRRSMSRDAARDPFQAAPPQGGT